MTTPRPKNESRRLLALRRHEIMDTDREPAFDRIVRFAARFFAMPMATISFVDEFRVWHKASHGLIRREASREGSLAAQVIAHKRRVVVRDVRADDRFCRSPLDIGPECARFHASAPLCTTAGHAVGVLSVMDTAPREFTAEDEDTLADLALLVVDEMELRLLTGRHRTEVDGRKKTQRTLSRQHHLLQRLGDSMDDRIQLRTAELMRANQSLRAEMLRRERADNALQQAKEEAEKANAAKSEFLSRMSHELRTPLNAILGFGRILQGPLSEEARHDCASHVVTAGRHLLSLINEVLDIARIEAGHLELSLEPVLVSEVVGEVLDLVRPLAAARSMTMDFSGANDVGGAVLADRQRVKQVLLNLLSNAIKYGPEAGRITIGCKAERAGMLRLTVGDTGPGLTREQSRRLFTAFDRLGAENSAIPGTGLGLALSKRFVEAMGGKVGVRTAVGQGSAFWLKLPLHPGALPAVQEPVAPDACPTVCVLPGACTMLYIDDNPSNVRLIEHMLIPCTEVKLICSQRGAEGLELARQRRPDLILLDLHLPDLPGLEVLARLRTGKATRQIPVAAISADATPDTIERVMQAGATAFLTMPLDVDSLYRLLPERCRPAHSISASSTPGGHD